MPDWLSIAVTFSNSRYHGHEWPPSPARLFQALLAGVMTGLYRERWDAASPILEWLERQSAPLIMSGAAHDAKAYRLAVPNNDVDIAAREWRKGRPYDAALLRTLKTVRPREMGDGAGVPHVRYLWPVEDADEDWTARVRALADCLHTLGWGIDMAYADTALLKDSQVRQLTAERWLPASGGGETWSVPIDGSLEDLRAVYERFKKRIGAGGRDLDPDTRPTVYGVQAYRREGQEIRPCARFALLKPDDDSPLAHDGRDAMVVAAWLRHACAGALAEEGESTDWINRYVHGHDPEGVPGQRMSFAPLLNVGYPHADGRIRRALVIEVAQSQGRAVELLQIKLVGGAITGEGGKGGCRLATQPQDHVLGLYLGRASLWRSVTPMVLHGHNTLRGKLSIHKTERLILEALEKSGYPARIVESVAFQPAPLWRGAPDARSVRVPQHLAGWPRYHVEVRFREAVQGPVLAGIGRHCGIGVFAACE
jgi:CRISPR-associated protein Csb2